LSFVDNGEVPKFFSSDLFYYFLSLLQQNKVLKQWK